MGKSRMNHISGDQMNASLIEPSELAKLTPRQQAETIAEDIARNTCETCSARYGWSMRYERQGNSFLIYCDGVPTNAIEIVDIQ